MAHEEHFIEEKLTSGSAPTGRGEFMVAAALLALAMFLVAVPLVPPVAALLRMPYVDPPIAILLAGLVSYQLLLPRLRAHSSIGKRTIASHVSLVAIFAYAIVLSLIAIRKHLS